VREGGQGPAPRLARGANPLRYGMMLRCTVYLYSHFPFSFCPAHKRRLFILLPSECCIWRGELCAYSIRLRWPRPYQACSRFPVASCL